MAQRAIERGFAVIQKQGALPPMMVYRVGGEYEVEPLAAKDSAEAGSLGRLRARQLTAADACVLLYETYLRLGGQRADAIIVEGHERCDEHAFVFAKRYQPGQPGQPSRLLDDAMLALGTAEPILPASPPCVETYVQTPSGTVISTLVTVLDRYSIECLILHQDRVVASRIEVKAPHKVACITRVDAADEWTPAHTDQLVRELFEIRNHLDPEDYGLATCLVAVTRDHLGSPPDYERLRSLLTGIQPVSRRVGGTGVLVLGSASKGPGSLEDRAISLIKGLQR